MKNYKKYIPGLFFFIAVTAVTFLDFNPLLTPTQEAGSEKVYTIPGISKGFIATQEITTKKDWINGIGLLFTTNGRPNTNDNTVLILDPEYKVLYSETFSSEKVRDNHYYLLNFGKGIRVGKGKTVYICHYSLNGDENNSVSVYCKPYSTIGKLYVSALPDNDVIRAVKNSSKLFPGSFAVQTYESGYNTSLLLKLVLYLMAAGLGLLILFPQPVFNIIARITLKPEIAFVIISAVFGMIFVFLTPPMQVPDEQSHFNRAYQVSELNIFKTSQTLPLSLLHLDTVYQRMKFFSGEKTTINELKDMTKVRLEPGVRLEKATNEYIIPYIPAAAGIFFGRILKSPPVVLMFIGRFCNLLFGIFLIWLTIKIVPVHKWVFFLLALMPMAMFMRSSLSYDVVKTGLSFLLTAFLLLLAYDEKKAISNKDYFYLFIIIICLALSKVPYFIPGLLFLLIPVNKIGSPGKYLVLFFSMILLPALAIEIASLGMNWFGPRSELLGERGYGMPLFAALGNSYDQIRFILANVTVYLGIMLKSIFVYYGKDWVISFIGNLGWMDTPLPSFIIIAWYIVLFLTAIGSPGKFINPGWKLKIIPMICFIMAIVIIETVLYIVASPYRGIAVDGVQGRYFIPYAPLLMLVFYNVYVSQKLNFALSFRKKEFTELKSNETHALNHEIQHNEMVFTRLLNFFLVCFSVFTLLITVYILAHRYYYIGESPTSVQARMNAEKSARVQAVKMQEIQEEKARFSNLAIEAAKAGKNDSTTYYLEKVVELDPSNGKVAGMLAMIYFKMNKRDKALQVIERMKANGLEVSKDLLDLLK
jgi:uncharacterized membrane protein